MRGSLIYQGSRNRAPGDGFLVPERRHTPCPPTRPELDTVSRICFTGGMRNPADIEAGIVESVFCSDECDDYTLEEALTEAEAQCDEAEAEGMCFSRKAVEATIRATFE